MRTQENYAEECRSLQAMAETIWRDQIFALKRNNTCEELRDCFNQLNEGYHQWKKCCPCIVRCTDGSNSVEGVVLGALLKLTIALEEKNCEVPKDIKERFTPKEREAVKKFDSTASIETMSSQQIAQNLEERQGIYGVVKTLFEQYEYFKDLIRPRNILEENERVRAPLANFLFSQWNARFNKAKEGLQEFMNNRSPTSFIHLFIEYEEALAKSIDLREETSKVEEVVDKKMFEFMEYLKDAENRKMELEREIAELERRLFLEKIESEYREKEEKMKREALEERVKELEKEKENLMREIGNNFNGVKEIFDKLEEAQKKLEEERAKLEELKEKAVREAREEVRKQLESEISNLQGQIEKYKEALLEKEKVAQALEHKNMIMEEKLTSLTKALKGEEEIAPVTNEVAVMYETIFIGKFQHKISQRKRFSGPIRKEEIEVKDLGLGIPDDEASKIRKMGVVDVTKFPRNSSLKYNIQQKGWFKNKTIGVVEAKFISHLESYVENGWDAKKASLGELLEILNQRIEMAREGEYFHILGIASPTGWDKKAIDFVSSRDYTQQFFNKYVYVYLVDMDSGEVYYNKDAYDRMELESYSELFKPDIEEAALTRTMECIEKELNRREEERGRDLAYITLGEAITLCKENGRIIKLAFEELQKKELQKKRSGKLCTGELPYWGQKITWFERGL